MDRTWFPQHRNRVLFAVRAREVSAHGPRPARTTSHPPRVPTPERTAPRPRPDGRPGVRRTAAPVHRHGTRTGAVRDRVGVAGAWRTRTGRTAPVGTCHARTGRAAGTPPGPSAVANAFARTARRRRRSRVRAFRRAVPEGRGSVAIRPRRVGARGTATNGARPTGGHGRDRRRGGALILGEVPELRARTAGLRAAAPFQAGRAVVPALEVRRRVGRVASKGRHGRCDHPRRQNSMVSLTSFQLAVIKCSEAPGARPSGVARPRERPPKGGLVASPGAGPGRCRAVGDNGEHG